MGLTREELTAEAAILVLANEHGKFAIELGALLSKEQQGALERLMLRDWIRLIDVAAIATGGGNIFRVFRAMPEAMFWLGQWRKELKP